MYLMQKHHFYQHLHHFIIWHIHSIQITSLYMVNSRHTVTLIEIYSFLVLWAITNHCNAWSCFLVLTYNHVRLIHILRKQSWSSVYQLYVQWSLWDSDTFLNIRAMQILWITQNGSITTYFWICIIFFFLLCKITNHHTNRNETRHSPWLIIIHNQSCDKSLYNDTISMHETWNPFHTNKFHMINYHIVLLPELFGHLQEVETCHYQYHVKCYIMSSTLIIPVSGRILVHRSYNHCRDFHFLRSISVWAPRGHQYPFRDLSFPEASGRRPFQQVVCAAPDPGLPVASSTSVGLLDAAPPEGGMGGQSEIIVKGDNKTQL